MGAGLAAADFGVMLVSGVLHTSLEPQASIVENPEPKLETAAGCGLDSDFGGGAGAEILKAELKLVVVEGFGGGAGGCDGADKSKRSPP